MELRHTTLKKLMFFAYSELNAHEPDGLGRRRQRPTSYQHSALLRVHSDIFYR